MVVNDGVGAGRDALERGAWTDALNRSGDDTLVLPSEYLEVVIDRR